MIPKYNVSVVIPTFNRQGTVERAIRSVLAQSRPPEEIIVVDDGSSDCTRDIIQSAFGQSVTYIQQSNKGVSSARNAGIRAARGNWIALLDSDDEWVCDKLQTQFDALSKSPEFTFCHTNEIWVRNGVRVNSKVKYGKSGGYVFKKCLPLCAISPSSLLIKKTVFEEVGFFNENFPVCEDYDFWLRYCCSHPVLYIDKLLVIKYGGHEDQLSKKFWGMDRYRARALLNIMASGKLSESQKEHVSATFFSKMDILIKGAEKHGNSQLLTSCKEMLEEMRALQKKYFSIYKAGIN